MAGAYLTSRRQLQLLRSHSNCLPPSGIVLVDGLRCVVISALANYRTASPDCPAFLAKNGNLGFPAGIGTPRDYGDSFPGAVGSKRTITGRIQHLVAAKREGVHTSSRTFSAKKM
jgi:hypothetical protein